MIELPKLGNQVALFLLNFFAPELFVSVGITPQFPKILQLLVIIVDLEMRGIDPRTSRKQSERSTILATSPYDPVAQTC